MEGNGVPKGLEGLEVAETSLGDVRGREGFFHYRGYDAIALANTRTLEDVWYLLFEGELPSAVQSAAFAEETRALRVIPPGLAERLPSLVRAGADPYEAARAVYSLLASELGFAPMVDVERVEFRRQGMITCAVFPTLVTAVYRIGTGTEPVEPDPELGYAANFLYMLSGEPPAPSRARALEKYLIATIDHGFNASTFAARVIASTGTDLASAILGALGALAGPLHGGAPSRALDMLEAIGRPDNIDPWLRDAVTHGRRLMGFGHRVYKTDDPRAVMLRGVAEELDGDIVELAKLVEKRAVAILEELKPGRALYPNVEFYAGIVLDMVGVPRKLFTATFASSRIIGWTAHVLEQAADNRLIRPAARYTGPPAPQPLP